MKKNSCLENLVSTSGLLSVTNRQMGMLTLGSVSPAAPLLCTEAGGDQDEGRGWRTKRYVKNASGDFIDFVTFSI